jgi:hypothetical protein
VITLILELAVKKLKQQIPKIKQKLLDEHFGINDDERLSLADIRLQTRTFEANIPIIFGEVLLAGNIIWTSSIRKIQYKENYFDLFNILIENDLWRPIKEVSLPKKELHFKLDFAIAICEGKVEDLLGVYIEGIPINTKDFKFRFYYGTNHQQPDPLIVKEKGQEGAIAFRGICYAVFEDFNLTDFGNIMPKFEFFVKRSNFAKGGSKLLKLKSQITGVNLMPASGEFVYETMINGIYEGVFAINGKIDGKRKHSNCNTNRVEADAMIALEQLKKDLPSLEWVSLVVTWFCDGVDISTLSIFPACEFNDIKTASYPVFWNVAGKKRWEVRQVSRRPDGSLNYGGTVNDSSLISMLKELRKEGYKIVLYPMLFVDLPEKPWRGRIRGDWQYIKNFFHKVEGYNNFIIHYAKIAKDFCDVFVIGSEMKALTSIKAPDGTFPAILEFVEIAKQIKSFAPNMKLTYAADWSEYHSFDGVFHMDSLWCSPFIDFIGIDAYFPLTHTTVRPKMEEIRKGWESGEGYDFYFKDGERIPYKNLMHAWKNLRYFLSNYHTNQDGTTTSFKPFSKKIWFMEFGFPSVELCTNQPNVFFDPTSSESCFPLLSSGVVDFGLQKDALLATLDFINANSDIIENAFVWCYDLRPYPFFPQRKDIWKDGDLWQRGHWLNGKLGSNTAEEVIKELCIKSGILEEELEFVNCEEMVEGMCINKSIPFSYYIKIVCDAFFIKKTYFRNGLKFVSFEGMQNEVLPFSSIVKKRGRDSKEFDEDEDFAGIPSKISLTFIDKTNKYEPTSIYFNIGQEAGFFEREVSLSLPIILIKEKAMQIAKNILIIKRSESFIKKITMPFNEAIPNVGSVMVIEESRFFIQNVVINDEFNIVVEGHNLPELSPFINLVESENEMLVQNVSKEELNIFALEVPDFTKESINFNLIGVFAINIPSSSAIFFQENLIGELQEECIKGEILEGCIDKINLFLEDNASFVKVYIPRKMEFKEGELYFASFGGEICGFKKAVHQGDGIFLISEIYRQRGGFINASNSSEFLLLSGGFYKVYLPSYINSGEFIIKYGDKNEKKVSFKVEGRFLKKFSIVNNGASLLNDGVILHWCFAVNYDFRDFEKTEYKNIVVEVKFLDQILRITGESHYIKGLNVIPDFSVNII